MKKSIIEKEWEAYGFKCKVIFVRQSHRCGYVGIPKGHVAYDKRYDELPIEVHGGLTYGEVEEDGLKWFGFDCAHLEDATASSPSGHFWTLEEVVEETEKMAKQFSELTLRKIIEYKLEWMPDWFKKNVLIKIAEQEMDVEELTENVRVWRISKNDDCLYLVMEEGELIVLKEVLRLSGNEEGRVEERPYGSCEGKCETA